MTVAVLALQGAFAEHEEMLEKLGVEHFQIRQKCDLERPFDALILPGGESTVQGKLMRELAPECSCSRRRSRAECPALERCRFR